MESGDTVLCPFSDPHGVVFVACVHACAAGRQWLQYPGPAAVSWAGGGAGAQVGPTAALQHTAAAAAAVAVATAVAAVAGAALQQQQQAAL